MHNTIKTPQNAKREFSARTKGRIRRDTRRNARAAKRMWLEM